MVDEESRGIGSHIFVLMMWIVTLCALLAALFLLRGAQFAHQNGATIPPAPAPAMFVIPQESAQKPPNKLVAPPPPF